MGIEIAKGVHLPQLSLGGTNATVLPQYPLTSNYSMWLEHGERGFDTAWEYQTQWDISKAIRESGIPRSQIFITTKIPGSVHGGSSSHGRYFPPYMTPDDARAKFHADLSELGVDYVDLLLLHEPCDYLAPYTYNDSVETAGVYAVMEEALANGTAKAIGVSNFRPEHFEPLLKTALVAPANQARMSIGNPDWETIRYCQQHNITYQVYSPLHGGGCDGVPASSSPTLQRIAQAHGMDIYQLQFRWMTQNNFAVVTATNKSSHMASDAKSFEFMLTDDDMSALNNCSATATQNIIV